MGQGTDNPILALFQIPGLTLTFDLPKIIGQATYYVRQPCIPAGYNLGVIHNLGK